MTPRYAQEQAFALQVVADASALAAHARATLTQEDIVQKEDLSPVTYVDVALQIVINLGLKQLFGQDALVGEEQSDALQGAHGAVWKEKIYALIRTLYPNVSAQECWEALAWSTHKHPTTARFWVVDPIDGTRGFIQHDQYAVALALIEDGKVVLGTLGCPRFMLKSGVQGALFHAVRGGGCICYDLATQTPTWLRSDPLVQKNTLIYCETPLHSRTHSHTRAQELATALHTPATPFRVDSQCKYAHVAYGDAALYLRIPKDNTRNEKIWDHAPGSILVEEAGGRVTDLDGAVLDFTTGANLQHNRGILASNGALHTQALALIRTLGI